MPKFKVGDKVKMNAFTDCFGKFHPEVRGLTVATVESYGAALGMRSYLRVKATYPDGYQWHEGAERFFSPDGGA